MSRRSTPRIVPVGERGGVGAARLVQHRSTFLNRPMVNPENRESQPNRKIRQIPLSRPLQWKRNGTDGSTSLSFFFATACDSPRTDVVVFVHSLSRAGLDGAQGVRAAFAVVAAIGVRSVTGTGRQIGRTSLGYGLFLILGGSRADLLFSRGGRQPATSARQPPACGSVRRVACLSLW